MDDAKIGEVSVAGWEGDVSGHRTHICGSCNFPMATRSRCAPCLHVFCSSCAAGMSICLVCCSPITKLETLDLDAKLYISPVTLQGFRSKNDFDHHIAMVKTQIGLKT